MREVTYNFLNKKFVVTGASSGMGWQIAVELAEAGALVLAIARREEKLQKLQSLFPTQIKYAVCDVTDKNGLEIVICDFVRENGKLNGCVHAAGISNITPIKMYNDQAAQEIMNSSFWAGINLIQICTKSKYCEQATSTVLFSSVHGHKAAKGMFAYSSAKAALQVAIRSIVKEISSKGHRINTISPGWVKTHMTENAYETADVQDMIQKHLLGEGSPEDVAGVVLFLLSDRAKWITGTDLIVDGGYLA